MAGVLLTALTLAATGVVASIFLYLAKEIDPLLGWVAALWLAFTTLALRSLHKESRAVVKLVEEGRPDEARQALALIVGRDTAGLSEEAVVKACIETVAENTSDGIVAPLFYLFLGGPVPAVLYKAANTLDSMVGYRNERYRELGWASARLDDLLNLIPARLTGVLMALAAWPLGLDSRGALKMMGRDARKPASPNAGFPEAAAAGSLGIQLGGSASYFGKQVKKPVLGDPERPVSVNAFRKMVLLMYLTSFLALALGVIITWLIR
jgi:adenosylcobinamide-phosphate synthase